MSSLAPVEIESRVIGHVRGAAPGPTIILVGGLHGNEPAGVLALRRVMDRLPDESEMRGEVLALAGNVAGLRRGVRYVYTDMNRGWWPDALEGPDVPVRGSEDVERLELLEIMEPVLASCTPPAIVVDLHTTSGAAPPFVTLGDTLRNRQFATAFPLPIILGLEEQLAGTFLEYVNNLGCITLGCEGGQHDDPVAVDWLEAVAWVALDQAGVLPPNLEPVGRSRGILAEAGSGEPRFLEVLYRHEVPGGTGYFMEPGYRSFQRVEEGELLGHWADGRPVEAPESGRLLMPLYQMQGDDGFFIVRPVRGFWLRLSAILRRMRADRLVTLLPGVRRHPYMSNAVIVDRRVARWQVIGIFHLLGFRRRVDQDREVILSRRHFDEPSFWD